MGKRKADYIYRREKSQYWYLRLQEPGQPERHLSLKTTNRHEAEVLAGPLITAHKRRLLERQQGRLRQFMEVEGDPMPPGDYPQPDGTRLICTGATILHLDATSRVIEERPNTPTITLVPDITPLVTVIPPELRHFKPKKKERVPMNNLFIITRRIKATEPDAAIVETWVKDRNIPPDEARKARETLDLFHRLTGKTLATATSDDARKLRDEKQTQGLKSATIQKHIGLLRSAVNIAVKTGKLPHNAFTGIGNSDGKDADQRLPFDDDDMAHARARLDTLRPELQLLWRVLATTGMRLSEAFEIKEEFKEKGVRFVIVGTKTPQSKRRVPIPAGLEPHLPEKITGPLFGDGSPKLMGKEMGRWLRRIGITDERKVLHSLRHRAKDRLRAEQCPLDIQYELLGHEKKTVAASYGRGHPVPLLKEWTDKIGD